MSSADSHHSLQAALPSNLHDYHAFIEQVLVKLKALGWEKSDVFGVHMALEESISNSIRHGNKLDPEKLVRVDCKVGRQLFWAKICDEGPGFKKEAVPDCREKDRIEVPGGRGLLLIQAYMTRTEYNDCGNCLTLEKRLGDDN